MKLKIHNYKVLFSKKYIFAVLSAFLLFLIIYLINYLGLQKVINEIENYGNFVPLVIILLRMTSSLIPILPGSSYAIIAGSLLGLKQGFIVIFLTDIITCTFCFFLSKKFGNFVVDRILQKKFLKRVKSIKINNSYKDIKMCSLLLMTGFHDFFSYAFGIINIPFKIYLISIILASSVTAPIYTMIGSGIVSENKITYFFISIFILLIINLRRTFIKLLKVFLK